MSSTLHLKYLAQTHLVTVGKKDWRTLIQLEIIIQITVDQSHFTPFYRNHSRIIIISARTDNRTAVFLASNMYRQQEKINKVDQWSHPQYWTETVACNRIFSYFFSRIPSWLLRKSLESKWGGFVSTLCIVNPLLGKFLSRHFKLSFR